MKRNGVNKGSGIMAQVMKEDAAKRKKGRLTLKSFKELLERMITAYDNRPRMTISGGYLMELDDTTFTYLYKREDVKCLCTPESQQKINNRAKKLGL